MNIRYFKGISRAAACAISVVLGGCSGAGAEEGVTVSALPLVITTCTGAAIAAAVTAGGSVILNCGSSPLTIQVPPTTVAHSTQLSSAQPGTVTFTHQGTLFDVTSGAALSISGISFNGMGGTSTALRSDGATVQSIALSNATVTQYTAFAIQVGGGSSLNVTNSTFQANGGMSFATPIYGEGAHVTVSGSTFSQNHSSGSGGAITALGGTTLSVNNCTFSQNLSGLGGAINATGSTTISNSTFAFNSASFAGGALALQGGGTVTNCTFMSNQSPRGTISGSPQVFGSIIFDSSASSAPCSLVGSSNIQWPAVTPLCGAGFRFADPKLGSLANNGGPTNTFALLPGSAALDSSTIACPPGSTDQRGVLRPRDGDGNGSAICDVGAYER